jgi:voltage-gated potassium channel Kch
LVLVSELISRITVQTCRQSGLSLVYTELLDFEGDEVYFQAEPALIGKTFGEALLTYEDSALIGLQPKDGVPHLNPPMNTLIAAGDLVIAISEDDDTIRLSGRATLPVDADAIQAAAAHTAAPERTLILGWNHRALGIIHGLEYYVGSGSQTVVVAKLADAEGHIARASANLRNQAVTFTADDTTSRPVLDALAVPTFQHVIVLSYSDTLGVQEADAQTLITLLHLRDIRERAGKDFSIVSEMLDVRNRALAEVTRADDFIVSDQLVSLVLAQVSEDKALNAVFSDLFDPAGSEIYLKPVADYVRLNSNVNFYTVVESAQRRSEIAIGYRLARDAHDASKAYGVVINPQKSAAITFAAGDRLIVLAEHQ